MPIENFEEEGLEKIPNIELGQLVHKLNNNRCANAPGLAAEILRLIQEDDMAPYLQYLLDKKMIPDQPQYHQLVKDLAAKNATKLAELDSRIKAAEESLEDTEMIRNAMLAKAHYLSKIGDKDAALAQFRLLGEMKKLMMGFRLDMIFHIIRIGFFFDDKELISTNIAKANSLIEEGGDWDRRNRLKVYRGLAHMCMREFQAASQLYLDGVATFTSYELMSYPHFITYTVLTALMCLPRPELRKKVVRGSEIQEVLHGLPVVKELLQSFYECRYADFFRYMISLEEFLYNDRYFYPHARFFIRELRVRAYEQQFESYRSLSMASMAEDFGVSVEFIDHELSRFIAAGRLMCRIDKVHGVVETIRPDNVNHQYQSLIKQGDVLLNRIQKLSRVINI